MNYHFFVLLCAQLFFGVFVNAGSPIAYGLVPDTSKASEGCLSQAQSMLAAAFAVSSCAAEIFDPDQFSKRTDLPAYGILTDSYLHSAMCRTSLPGNVTYTVIGQTADDATNSLSLSCATPNYYTSSVALSPEADGDFDLDEIIAEFAPLIVFGLDSVDYDLFSEDAESIASECATQVASAALIALVDCEQSSYSPLFDIHEALNAVNIFVAVCELPTDDPEDPDTLEAPWSVVVTLNATSDADPCPDGALFTFTAPVTVGPYGWRLVPYGSCTGADFCGVGTQPVTVSCVSTRNNNTVQDEACAPTPPPSPLVSCQATESVAPVFTLTHGVSPTVCPLAGLLTPFCFTITSGSNPFFSVYSPYGAVTISVTHCSNTPSLFNLCTYNPSTHQICIGGLLVNLVGLVFGIVFTVVDSCQNVVTQTLELSFSSIITGCLGL